MNSDKHLTNTYHLLMTLTLSKFWWKRLRDNLSLNQLISCWIIVYSSHKSIQTVSFNIVSGLIHSAVNSLLSSFALWLPCLSEEILLDRYHTTFPKKHHDIGYSSLDTWANNIRWERKQSSSQRLLFYDQNELTVNFTYKN